jgi:hypothetical protein
MTRTCDLRFRKPFSAQQCQCLQFVALQCVACTATANLRSHIYPRPRTSASRQKRSSTDKLFRQTLISPRTDSILLETLSVDQLTPFLRKRYQSATDPIAAISCRPLIDPFLSKPCQPIKLGPFSGHKVTAQLVRSVGYGVDWRIPGGCECTAFLRSGCATGKSET